MTTDPDSPLARLQAWTAGRPWMVDALIVAAIIGLGSARAPDDFEDFADWFCTVGLALPLFYRRQFPVGIFLLLAFLSLVVWAGDVRSFGFSALLVALYTVATTQPLRTTLAMSAIVEVGVVLASVRWSPHHHPEDTIVALSGLALAAAVLGFNVRGRQALLASLQERAERLEAERDQQSQLAAAAERARIAREMHDIVAHNLSVMIALTEGATYALAEHPEQAEEALTNASSTGREALTEMRRLLGVLRDGPPTAALAPQPGLGQLAALVEQLRAAGMATTLTVEGLPPDHVSGSLELAAFRIVQESLTNALKHAGTGVTATVHVRWDERVLRLRIANTGEVAALPSPDVDGGGLRGMRERAAIHGGTVTAGPSPDGGWAVEAVLTQTPAAVPDLETHR